MLDYLQTVDWTILHGIQDTLKCSFLDYIMPIITQVGNGGAIWILTAIFLMFKKNYRKYGVCMIFALVIGVLVGNVCLKPLFARSRPCWIESVTMLIDIPKDYSFPSGHTLSSMIGAYMLSSADKRFRYFAIPMAALIAFSRMYLYVHFPTDVLASVVLGVTISRAVLFIADKATLKLHKYSF